MLACDLALTPAVHVAGHPETQVHFSQFGEDAVVQALLGVAGLAAAPGFYVDVGAHDPVRGSNTHLLHLRGWSGVNIDGNPAAIERFQQLRPHDCNLHAVVSDRETEVEFDIYELAALSTADPATKQAYAREGRAQLVQRLRLPTYTLRAILHHYVPPGQSVDLMSVDAEGLDLAVLRSNDWDRFAPAILLVEDPRLSLQQPQESEIFRFVAALGYRLASQAFITSIYLRP